MQKAYIKSPCGVLEVIGDRSGLAKVEFLDADVAMTKNIPDELLNATNQLREYFEGSRAHFELKLNPKGTDFQKKVWKELVKIPFGKSRSYQQLANKLGDPKVIRAAAAANGQNPIAIIIPCHRVIGSDGSLVGYAGGLHRKKWLLAHESPVQQQSLF